MFLCDIGVVSTTIGLVWLQEHPQCMTAKKA